MSVSDYGRVDLKELFSSAEGQAKLGLRLSQNLGASGWRPEREQNGRPSEGGSETGPWHDAIGHLLGLLGERVEATHAILVLLDGEPREWTGVWSVGFGAEGADVGWVEERWEALEGVLGGGERTWESVDLPATGTSTAGQEGSGRGSLWATPVTARDRTLGILAVGALPARVLSASERMTLDNAGFVLGQTIGDLWGEEGSRGILYAMIQSLAAALDTRDAYTRGHSDRVAMYAMAITNELGRGEEADLPGGFRDELRLAALLHDIGKIGIRDEILLKPAALTDQEYGVIKKHPVLGAEIVKSSGALDYIVPGILYHHERCDGSGYPLGLTGEEIPLVARIIGLADAFDAMTSDRTFRPAMSQDEAVGILQKLSGTHFAPDLVEALVNVYRQGILSSVRVAPAGAKEWIETEASQIEKTFPGLGDRIPSLPAVVAKLNQMVSDPDSSVSDIAQVLSSDEGLVSRVLRIANSAFYALPGRVGTIPLAITILGIRTLRSLVIGTALAEITRSLSGSAEEASRVWDHSVNVGVWCRWIARKVGGADPEEAFTAGLLHDVGKGLVLQVLPADRQRIRPRLLEAEESCALEKEILGFDHCELGGWAAHRWRLPGVLIKSVRWHHEPEGAVGEKREVERLVWIVHVADILAGVKEASAGDLAQLLNQKADPVVVRNLPLRDEKAIEDLLPFVEGGLELARTLFSEETAQVAAGV